MFNRKLVLNNFTSKSGWKFNVEPGHLENIRGLKEGDHESPLFLRKEWFTSIEEHGLLKKGLWEASNGLLVFRVYIMDDISRGRYATALDPGNGNTDGMWESEISESDTRAFSQAIYEYFTEYAKHPWLEAVNGQVWKIERGDDIQFAVVGEKEDGDLCFIFANEAPILIHDKDITAAKIVRR